jgi:hypothetical protein
MFGKAIIVILLILTKTFHIVKASRASRRRQKRQHQVTCQDLRNALSIEKETCPPMIDPNFKNIYKTRNQEFLNFYRTRCDIKYVPPLNIVSFTFLFWFIGLIFILARNAFKKIYYICLYIINDKFSNNILHFKLFLRA